MSSVSLYGSLLDFLLSLLKVEHPSTLQRCYASIPLRTIEIKDLAVCFLCQNEVDFSFLCACGTDRPVPRKIRRTEQSDKR